MRCTNPAAQYVVASAATAAFVVFVAAAHLLERRKQTPIECVAHPVCNVHAASYGTG